MLKPNYSKELVSIMAIYADALAYAFTRSSAAMVLSMQDKFVLVLNEEFSTVSMGIESTKYLNKLLERW